MDVKVCPPVSFLVREVDEVGQARRAAASAAIRAGLGTKAVSDVSIVATELATNLVRHARGGEMIVQCLPGSGPGTGTVEILAFDSGQGMSEPERCLRDGYSTAGSPGTGLGAVRRLSSEFDLYTQPGRGTVVMARVRDAAAPGDAAPSFRWGAICIPIQGEQVCGDAFAVEARGEELRAVVADGLGHGPEAEKAASAATRCFPPAESPSPQAFLQRAHLALQGTRGAAAIALVALRGDSRLVYGGVGNVSGTLITRDGRQGLVSQNGTLGLQVRHVKEFAYPMPPGSSLVIHSDGLQARWSMDQYPGLVARAPSVVACTLYRDFRRGRDDTTVLVVQVKA